MQSASELAEEFVRVRGNTRRLCEPLQVEDYGLQAMANTSPPKWHLAHTTWFFETFVLKSYIENYSSWHPLYEHIFNSYYNTVGTPFFRSQRGLLSRPGVNEIYRYREAIDQQILALLEKNAGRQQAALGLIELGLHHEQQHQELLLTDLKYSFHCNPMKPAYQDEPPDSKNSSVKPRWHSFEGGLVDIGADSDNFYFDNEAPRHRQYLEPFELSSRPVTNGEFVEFIEDGGYQNAELWLSDGWETVNQFNWQAPLYWQRQDSRWHCFTLHGETAIVPDQPACHLSFYEADAYARWAGARLPTEAEWEHVARDYPVTGNFLNSGRLHPRSASENEHGPQQLFGDVWEWTASSYAPYPGFKPNAGAIGEYNGKFMSNQMVLRGGSCASDVNHIRASYRNFFYPADRWQFSGLRLARTVNE